MEKVRVEHGLEGDKEFQWHYSVWGKGATRAKTPHVRS